MGTLLKNETAKRWIHFVMLMAVAFALTNCSVSFAEEQVELSKEGRWLSTVLYNRLFVLSDDGIVYRKDQVAAAFFNRSKTGEELLIIGMDGQVMRIKAGTWETVSEKMLYLLPVMRDVGFESIHILEARRLENLPWVMMKFGDADTVVFWNSDTDLLKAIWWEGREGKAIVGTITRAAPNESFYHRNNWEVLNVSIVGMQQHLLFKLERYDPDADERLVRLELRSLPALNLIEVIDAPAIAETSLSADVVSIPTTYQNSNRLLWISEEEKLTRWSVRERDESDAKWSTISSGTISRLGFAAACHSETGSLLNFVDRDDEYSLESAKLKSGELRSRKVKVIPDFIYAESDDSFILVNHESEGERIDSVSAVRISGKDFKIEKTWGDKCEWFADETQRRKE